MESTQRMEHPPNLLIQRVRTRPGKPAARRVDGPDTAGGVTASGGCDLIPPDAVADVRRKDDQCACREVAIAIVPTCEPRDQTDRDNRPVPGAYVRA
jgi:hypothetical protein